MKFPHQHIPYKYIKYAKNGMKITTIISVVFLTFIMILLSYSLIMNKHEPESNPTFAIIMCGAIIIFMLVFYKLWNWCFDYAIKEMQKNGKKQG